MVRRYHSSGEWLLPDCATQPQEAATFPWEFGHEGLPQTDRVSICILCRRHGLWLVSRTRRESLSWCPSPVLRCGPVYGVSRVLAVCDPVGKPTSRVSRTNQSRLVPTKSTGPTHLSARSRLCITPNQTTSLPMPTPLEWTRLFPH